MREPGVQPPPDLDRDTARAAGDGGALLRAAVLTGVGVAHAFTTRLGGVSQGPLFASLNFGNPSDLPAEKRDPPENIGANWGVVLGALGCGGREVVQSHQVHGAAVLVVRAGTPAHAERDADGRPVTTRADAIVTDDPARVVAVRVADCAPVLLASGDGRVVGAVHAGWRGVVGGVLPAAVEAMRTLGARGIFGAIGPCISAQHFEVGPEVVAEFERVFPGGAVVREHADAAARGAGKAMVDLRAALALQARDAGVERFEALDACTVRDAGLFFSHRRERGLTGRVIGPRGG